DGAEVNEDVVRAVVGSDEPVALVVAEPLNGSGRHLASSSCALNTEDAETQRLRAARHDFAGKPGLTCGTVALWDADAVKPACLGLKQPARCARDRPRSAASCGDLCQPAEDLVHRGEVDLEAVPGRPQVEAPDAEALRTGQLLRPLDVFVDVADPVAQGLGIVGAGLPDMAAGGPG